MNRIADYALIGDCHSLALVGRDGAVDWACFPRFDSSAVFCRMLDVERGGHFTIAPANSSSRASVSVTRSYVDDTNVLVTTFLTESGSLEVTDCMPVTSGPEADPTSVSTDHCILRRVRCTSGNLQVRVEIAPRFEYGSFVPRFRLRSPHSGEIVGGADAMWAQSTRQLESDGERFTGSWSMHAGEEAWVAVAWYPSIESPRQDPPVRADDFEAKLARTISFWRSWMSRCAYEGDHADSVRRSALVLKALTYSPSGAVVAAGTASLPEAVGGHRNWDYRYTWIRDATLTLTALFVLGFSDEATAFKRWLERSGSGRPQDLQIMYGVCGERRLPEHTLAHLRGHRDSRPVLVGNAAAGQSQLDCFGQLMQAAHLYCRAGGGITEDNWRYLVGLADLAASRWSDPDHGIWEIRDEPRHFVHSKAYCWLALDRGTRLTRDARTADSAGWRTERDAICQYLMSEAASRGCFRQAVGNEAADASTLILPAIGLLPTTHPFMLKTIDVVRSELEQEGLVFRYLSPDGLPGDEGAFLLCSFWLLDCLVHAGRLDEAEWLLERILTFANDVGLYAEEVDPSTGEALGNFPQAFTHMALVSSCSYLEAAKRGFIPLDGAYDYAELAIDRLVASRGLISQG